MSAKETHRVTEPKRARSDSVAYKADDEANDVTTERGGKTRDGRNDAYTAVPEARQEPVPLVVRRRHPKERPRSWCMYVCVRVCVCVREGIAHPSAPPISRRPDTFALHSRRIQQVKALLTSDVPCARPGQPPDTASLRDIALFCAVFSSFLFLLLLNNERNGEDTETKSQRRIGARNLRNALVLRRRSGLRKRETS